MNPDDVLAVLQEHINKSIDAKLIPALGLVTGVELAVAHIFNCLHQKGVLSLDEALQSLAATREGLPEGAGPVPAMAIRHIERALADIREKRQTAEAATSEGFQTTFRVIPGGLSETEPKDQD